MKYFSVKFQEAEKPKGIASACCRTCMVCHRILSGMGGPGNWICEDCLEKIQSGYFEEAMYLIEQLKLQINTE